MALGSIIAPGLVSWLGPRGALIAAGASLPVLLVPLWPSLRRIDSETEIAEEPLELLRRIEIFSQLPEAVLERLAGGATPCRSRRIRSSSRAAKPAATSTSSRRGAPRSSCDDGTTRELEPGAFFGEIALLRDVPRTATVRALDSLQLYAVERDAFLAAVTGHAPSLAAAENIVTSRLPAGALLG